MWLCRVFGSAFVRKAAYILAGALLALVFHEAHASGCFGVTGAGFGSQSDSYAAVVQSYETTAQGVLDYENSLLDPATQGQYHLGTCTPSGLPQDANGSTCSTTGNGGVASTNVTISSGVATGCSGDCGGKPNMDIIAAIQGNTGAMAGELCVAGCGYTNSAASLVVGGPKATVYGQAIPTGQACTSGATTGTQGNCASGGGVTTCYDSTNGKATVNGEVIAKVDVPTTADTCTQYASGGTMCTYTPTKPLTTPPAPSTDGTTPTVPEAVITQPGTTPVTAAVYSAAQNAASVNPVTGTATHPAGGTGGGTGTGNTAANGDCGATGVDCVADGGMPSLTRSDTIQSDVQSYMDSIKASPLVSGFSNITNSWPTADCPQVNFTLWGHVLDANAAICTVWGGTVAPTLSLVFLAIWAVAGIRVIMSA